MLKKLLVAASLAVAAVLPSAAHAQDQWERQVRSLLQDAGKQVESRGYQLTHRIVTGSLNQGASETVSVDLDIGKEYEIIGVCDTDCSDLDTVLYDGTGNKVDEDVLQDDVPIVSVTVTRSGTFRVTVTMASCSNAPCRYGLGVFGK
jgi:hypothetical protein